VCVCFSVLMCTRACVYMCVQLCVSLRVCIRVCPYVFCVGAKMICVYAVAFEEQLLIN